MRITSFKHHIYSAVVGLAMALFASHVSATTIAHWRFEEGVAGNGPTTSIQDSSGNELHGTPSSGLSFTNNTPNSILPQTGESNNLAMNFNGANTTRVSIADDPLFQLTGSMTLEMYINMAALPRGSHNAELLFRGDSRIGYDPYVMHITNGRLQYLVSAADNRGAAVSTALPALNQWVHIAGVLDDATGSMSLYMDGVLVDSKVTDIRAFAALDPSLNAGLSIGGYPATDYIGPFNGMIDEVRISDMALSPDEFLNAAPVPEPATAVVFLMGVAGMALRKRSLKGEG